MKKNFFLLILVCLSSNLTFGQKSLDKMFKRWNEKTFKSLYDQYENSTDSIQKRLFANRIKAFKSYLEINKLAEVNSNSIRYLFLKKIREKYTNTPSKKLIIEANQSGYVNTIRNFIIYQSSNGIIVVDEYRYEDNNWILYKTKDEKNKLIQNNLKFFLCYKCKGINTGDVIISLFDKNHIKESIFFFENTLSQSFYLNIFH